MFNYYIYNLCQELIALLMIAGYRHDTFPGVYHGKKYAACTCKGAYGWCMLFEVFLEPIWTNAIDRVNTSLLWLHHLGLGVRIRVRVVPYVKHSCCTLVGGATTMFLQHVSVACYVHAYLQLKM